MICDNVIGGYEYKNICTPLQSINAHMCGGLTVTLQDPHGKLTTYGAQFNTFELIIALDCDYLANGYVYLDDGVSSDTKRYMLNSR